MTSEKKKTDKKGCKGSFELNYIVNDMWINVDRKNISMYRNTWMGVRYSKGIDKMFNLHVFNVIFE